MIMSIFRCRVCGWEHRELHCAPEPALPDKGIIKVESMPEPTDDLYMGDDYKEKVEFLEKAAKAISEKPENCTLSFEDFQDNGPDENDAFIDEIEKQAKAKGVEKQLKKLAEEAKAAKNKKFEKLAEEAKAAKNKKFEEDQKKKNKNLMKQVDKIQKDILDKQIQYNQFQYDKISDPWHKKKKGILEKVIEEPEEEVEPEEPKENACPECDFEMVIVDEVTSRGFKYLTWQCPACDNEELTKERLPTKKKATPGIGKRKVKFSE